MAPIFAQANSSSTYSVRFSDKIATRARARDVERLQRVGEAVDLACRTPRTRALYRPP